MANHLLSIERENIVVRRKFIATLLDAISALAEPRNITKDAFVTLEQRFFSHHSAYHLALNACGPIRKYRLRKSWCDYYGADETDEQEWWLPNEYGTILSNKLGNTADNTRSLAIKRLKTLIDICI
jgi:hypothetical protein